MSRTVLITGGTSGIGRAAAALFAADGERVLITGRRPEGVERAVAELSAEGAAVEGLASDATDPRQVAELAAAVGELHVLVNCSGGLPGPASADLAPLDAVPST